jgi:hypothetical protein
MSTPVVPLVSAPPLDVLPVVLADIPPLEPVVAVAPPVVLEAVELVSVVPFMLPTVPVAVA